MKKLLLVVLLIVQTVFAQSELLIKLNQLPGVEITEIEVVPPFNEAYEIMLEQPVNHLRPNGERFTQKMFLSHVDFDKPMVMETEGYSIRDGRHTELSKMLKCNELIIEHRYFGDSVPKKKSWKNLTVEQAAADHHRIVELFKMIYKDKWINTGISKGGQTTLYHRAFYPDDVDVSVPYVAPLNFEVEERRIQSFLENVGTEECRERILDFQNTVLKRRDEIFPLFVDFCIENKFTFECGIDVAFEYTVFEYSFAFWQWGYVKCEDIPEYNAKPKKILDHLVAVSSPSFFDDKGMESLAPFMYQAYTEIGFYGYDTTPFKEYLEAVNTNFATNEIFAPAAGTLEYSPETMRYIYDFLKNEGNNILYIYGEYDTWSATGVEIGNKTNALKMVKEKASHRTRIRHFNGEKKEKILTTLEKWLDIEIERE